MQTGLWPPSFSKAATAVAKVSEEQALKLVTKDAVDHEIDG